MYVVGFTGKSAAGKGIASEVLRSIAQVKSMDIEYSDLLIGVLNEWFHAIGQHGYRKTSQKAISSYLLKLPAIINRHSAQSLPDNAFTLAGSLSQENYKTLVSLFENGLVPAKAAAITRSNKDEHYIPILNWLGRASREVAGGGIWGSVMEERLKHLEGDVELITIGGIRTPDAETQPIRSRGGTIIRVVRRVRGAGAEIYHNDGDIQDIIADAEVECLEDYDAAYLRPQLLEVWGQIQKQQLPLKNHSSAISQLPHIAEEIVHSLAYNKDERAWELAAEHKIQEPELELLAVQAIERIIDTSLIDALQLTRRFDLARHIRGNKALTA